MCLCICNHSHLNKKTHYRYQWNTHIELGIAEDCLYNIYIVYIYIIIHVTCEFVKMCVYSRIVDTLLNNFYVYMRMINRHGLPSISSLSPRHSWAARFDDSKDAMTYMDYPGVREDLHKLWVFSEGLADRAYQASKSPEWLSARTAMGIYILS